MNQQTNSKTCIFWFRRDLRLADNPALHRACASFANVIPLFIWAPAEEEPWAPGSASRWWLHHSLKNLARQLSEKGSLLLLRKGPSLNTLLSLVEESGASAVYWNRLYDPSLVQRDEEIKETLKSQQLEVMSFNSSLLVEPWEIKNASSDPYQVFTPFWKTLNKVYCHSDPLKKPRQIPGDKNLVSRLKVSPANVELDNFCLLPTIDWTQGISSTWQPGEEHAKDLLRGFSKSQSKSYSENRDRPDIVGTSRLSPYLHFGEISPRQIWQVITTSESASIAESESRQAYLRQIAWREFAHHLLFHFPHTTNKPLRSEFANFPWRTNRKRLTAWQKGQTGYPGVDAAMRELWHTGWMHNRMRMVVGSFLVKHLLVPWQLGAAWFWDTLVDANLANNTLGWQWIAGCGADAAPYFRVFNPTKQIQRFDPQGHYLKLWLPELGELNPPEIFQPWASEKATLSQSIIASRKTYPQPIIDQDEGRASALRAYEEFKRSTQKPSANAQ